MRIAAVGRALPKHYYDQARLTEALTSMWRDRHHNVERIAAMYKNAVVGGRYTVLPLERYAELTDFGATNDVFIDEATKLGAEALGAALAEAGLDADAVDHIFFVSVTGIATPSIDARIVNRMRLRPNVKRTPIFGLGCVAGAAGLARAADYVRAFPREVAVVVSVELCSLTLQRNDLSMANIVASGLFGDGAAAVVVQGANCPRGSGPDVVATRSAFYPDTEDVLGWRITAAGFRIVLSAEVPQLVARHLGPDVDSFLAENGLRRAQIDSYVCHAGGPKVMDAVAQAMQLTPQALQLTRDSLAQLGNVSSASVLMVLQDTMETQRPPPQAWGLLLALGPGFCAEMVLLRW